MLRTPFRLALILAASLLLLGACGDDEPTEDIGTTPEETEGTEEPWEPQGAEPAVLVEVPADGGSITIQVGDRIRLPEADGDFATVLDHDERDARKDILVPYGDTSTYLAIAPGEFTVQQTKYDPARSCVPPQPVAELTVLVTDGPRPNIGDPVEVTIDDDGETIEVVPGQALTFDPELILRVDESGRGTIVDVEGHALRPGTVEVSLSTVPSPRSADEWISVTVVVLDPTDGAVEPSEDAAAVTATVDSPVRFIAAAPSACE